MGITTVLYNGFIVTEDNVISGYSVIIRDGIIHAIVPNELIGTFDYHQKYNCTNLYILPGLIDIHSDSIEKVIVPRKGIKFDVELAIHEMDCQLSHQGITSIYHSLSMADTTICNNVRTITPTDIFSFCDLLSQKTCNDLLIHHYVHVRLELNTFQVYNKLTDYIRRGLIHELSFMDHTPGQGQYRNIALFEKVIKQQYGNISDEEKENIISICKKKKKLDYDKLLSLASCAKENNISIAYHDVETEGQVDWMVENNFKICEFPLNAHVSEYAMKKGLYSVVGSPNVYFGRSQYNNASATDLLTNKQANILCSDFFSPTLLFSIFKLHRSHGMSLPEATKLATINPAQALGIDGHYGSITIGKKADIIAVDAKDSIPRVMMTIVGGMLKNSITYR